MIIVQQTMMTSMSLVTPVADALSHSTSDNELNDLSVCAVLREVICGSTTVLCGLLQVLCGFLWSFAVFNITPLCVSGC